MKPQGGKTIMKLRYTFVVLVLLLVSVCALGADAVKNPTTLVVVGRGKANTLDPIYCYNGGLGLVEQVYEALIAYKEGAPDEFVPLVAAEVPTVENGLISEDGLTYKFPIRGGITFTNGNPLTAEDVEYSFERALVVNPSGGPVWMLAEVLLPDYTAQSFDEIDSAIEVEDNTVIFHLRNPSTFFLKILPLPFHGIVDKETVSELGGWPGTAETWKDYADQPLEESVLSKTIIGTGPFILESWTPGVQVSFVRNENYWREPASLERVLIQRVDEWTTRRLMLENGDADIVEVPQPYLAQVERMEGVRVIRDLPMFAIEAIFLTRDINKADNPYIGSGKLDGNGIPSDFFNDLNVRKGFNYAFDANTYIEDVMEGVAFRPATCIPFGVAYFDPELAPYPYDPDLAEAYLREAFDGALWEQGFKFTIAYMSGEVARKAAAEVLELGLESLNPNFQVELQSMPEAEYMAEFMAHRLPAFVWNWIADYLDPHNFAYPFMHSAGFYADSQNITGYDELIEQGGTMSDGPEREALYKQLQQICRDDALSIFYAQPTWWHVEREWVKGWYRFIPQYVGNHYYPLSKSAE